MKTVQISLNSIDKVTLQNLITISIWYPADM